MNDAAVEEMMRRHPDLEVLFIESGGDNLSATFSPELVDFSIYVIDVAQGEKIPRKAGHGGVRLERAGQQQAGRQQGGAAGEGDEGVVQPAGHGGQGRDRKAGQRRFGRQRRCAVVHDPSSRLDNLPKARASTAKVGTGFAGKDARNQKRAATCAIAMSRPMAVAGSSGNRTPDRRCGCIFP